MMVVALPSSRVIVIVKYIIPLNNVLAAAAAFAGMAQLRMIAATPGGPEKAIAIANAALHARQAVASARSHIKPIIF